MSSSYEERRQQLEKILKEIYRISYHSFESKTLYYKEKGKSLERENWEYLPTFPTMLEIALNPNLEYAVYVSEFREISPSLCCMEVGSPGCPDVYSAFLYQFMSPLPYFMVTFNYLQYFEDPLRQVFTYTRLQYVSQHNAGVYYCGVFKIIPGFPDPSSLFPSWGGIVAYCITVSDLVFTFMNSRGLELFNREITSVIKRAYDKLRNNKKLEKLWYKNSLKACNVDLLKSIIHDEIEEAERVMRKYNIIRVAFSLDKLWS